MSWRIVTISTRAKLDCRMGYLVVRRDETTKIHLSEIAMIIVENTAVSLTAALLVELDKRKIKVIFCDEKRNPCSELVSFYGSHDTSAKIRSQIKWSDDVKEVVWTAIVTEKILNQARLLKHLGKQECEKLFGYVEEIELNDESNREGHAAKVYFNALFGKGFTRAEDSDINKALNYGYGILLSSFNREIVADGYLTQLGLFHDNMFNFFNLSSDLMEPFRPLVDKCVYNLKDNVFDSAFKYELVNILNTEVKIDGKTNTVNKAIKIYCTSVFNAIENGDTSFLRFYGNEL